MYYSGFQCVSESGGGTLANVSSMNGCEIGFEQNVSCYLVRREHSPYCFKRGEKTNKYKIYSSVSLLKNKRLQTMDKSSQKKFFFFSSSNTSFFFSSALLFKAQLLLRPQERKVIGKFHYLECVQLSLKTPRNVSV